MSRSRSSKEFVKHLLEVDAADRPHADQALEHEWLQRNRGYKMMQSILGGFMMKSMMKFLGSSPLTRRCLFIVAARCGSPKLDQIGETFLNIDDGHTGHISREALAAFVSAAASCWEPEFDIDDFFDAADQESKNSIGFLEFAATCIWGAEDTRRTILERAFRALDDNHDGMVHMDDCRHLFRDIDFVELRKVPMNRHFSMEEWCMALGCSHEAKQMPMKEPELSMIERFMRALICSEDQTGAMDGGEMVYR